MQGWIKMCQTLCNSARKECFQVVNIKPIFLCLAFKESIERQGKVTLSKSHKPTSSRSFVAHFKNIELLLESCNRIGI